MNENTNDEYDDFVMGIIFWLLVAIGYLGFISYVVQEVTFYQIEKTNEKIIEEWNS